jgi:hypothetical protein
VARRRLGGSASARSLARFIMVLGGAAAEAVVSPVVPLEEQGVGVAACVQDLEGALAEAGDEAAAAGVGGLVPAELADLAGPPALGASASSPAASGAATSSGRDGVLVDGVLRSAAEAHDLLERRGLRSPAGPLASLARGLLGSQGRRGLGLRGADVARRSSALRGAAGSPGSRGTASPRSLPGHSAPSSSGTSTTSPVSRSRMRHHPVVRADLVDDITLRHCSTSMPQCRAAPHVRGSHNAI